MPSTSTAASGGPERSGGAQGPWARGDGSSLFPWGGGRPHVRTRADPRGGHAAAARAPRAVLH
eukprot:9547067-Alexandrium_andersonii.AAC.1